MQCVNTASLTRYAGNRYNESDVRAAHPARNLKKGGDPMAFYEKTLKSDIIYEGRIMRVRSDTVELQDGSTAYREVVDHTGGVGVLAVTPEGAVPMVRQFRYPFMAETLEIPAGKLERGEEPIACAARELSEETGYTAGRLISLGTLLPSPGYCAEMLHIFLALDLTPGKAHLDEEEFLNVEHYPLKKLHEMTMSGELVDAKTVLAVLKAEIYLGELK